MNKISIIGAGNVGSTLAFLLAQKELGQLVLVDINKDLAIGKALDIYQACSVLGIDCKILAGDQYENIYGSEIVVITCGFPRKPGMDRIELLRKNAQIIKEVVSNIVKYAPNSIILMVTNPLDIMTYYAYKLSGFDRKKVFGQAGILDSARLSAFISEKLNLSVQNINSTIIGPHDNNMFACNNYTTVAGIPIFSFLKQDEFKNLVQRCRNAGKEIVELIKTSAYYAPAAGCLKMIESIIKDKNYICCASVYLEGEYGLDDICIGVPVKLSKNGIEEIIHLDLTDEEKAQFIAAAKILKETVKELPF